MILLLCVMLLLNSVFSPIQQARYIDVSISKLQKTLENFQFVWCFLMFFLPFYGDVMYHLNRSFNSPCPPPPPPGYTPGIWYLCRTGEEGIWLSESSRGWGIWTIASISCEISGRFALSYHGGRSVRRFTWKRLCLCGQLVTREGLKQAFCRI